MTQPTTAYAVILSTADGHSLAQLATTPECAVRAVSPFEGAQVLGLATIALEPEPITGMHFVLREIGPNAEPVALAREPSTPSAQVVGHVCRDVSQARMVVNLPEGTPLYTTPSAQAGEVVCQWQHEVVLRGPSAATSSGVGCAATGGRCVPGSTPDCPRTTPQPQGDASQSAQAGEVVRIGELIRTQDNRITSHPIFVVEQKREHVSHPDYDHDRMVWVDGDGEATAEDAARLDAEYADTGKTPDGWRRCAVGHSWEFVTACFTEQGCKDYLAANGHNLRETRIFVYSGWRNAEWQAIRAYLSVTPQPQGDASPEVSGGGDANEHVEVLRRLEKALPTVGLNGWAKGVEAVRYAIAALSTPQARPDGGDDEAARRYIRDWCPDHVKDYIDRHTHPTPAPDAVARLVEEVGRRVEAWRECKSPLAAQEAMFAIANAHTFFTAAQQEGE